MGSSRSINWAEQMYLASALLELSIGHIDVQLLCAALDSIPACQSAREMDISTHTEVRWVDNFVGRWIVENGFSMDPGFMSEGAEASDGVVERDVDFYGLANEVLDIFQFMELVFGSYIFSVHGDHTCH